MFPEVANNPGGEGTNASEAEELANVADEQIDETEVQEGAEGQPQQDDTDEVEHEGQKYRVPKALKGSFLMHADYTQKTQALAADRKAYDERSKTFNDNAQFITQHQADVARLVNLNDQIAQFEKADWQAIRANNREQADDLWFQYQQLLTRRSQVAGELQTKVTKWNSDQAAFQAKLKSDAQAILQRDVKDWSADTAGKVRDFISREFGFRPEELDGVIDPRIWKAMHRAYLGDQAVKKAAAAAKLKAQEGVQPAPKVGGKAASTATIRADSPASDRLSADEWLKRRNEQVRKQA